MLNKSLALTCLSLALQLLLPVQGMAVEPVSLPRSGAAIINGSASANGGQPWIAALIRKTTLATPIGNLQFCGGTLIAPTWVLTAAHCVASVSADAIQVVVGREALNGNEGELHDVVELIIHPAYQQPGSFGADLALVRLTSAASAQPLRRAVVADETALTDATVSVYGWGYKNYRTEYDCNLNIVDTVPSPDDFRCDTFVFSNGTSPADMLEGQLSLFSYANCDARYKAYLASKDAPVFSSTYFSEELTPSVLCAWDPANVHSPCFGDSGGPLVGTVNGAPVLLGVVSFGYVSECALQGQLGIYSRVSYQAAFIDEVIGREQALGFAALCPPQPDMTISYAPQADGRNIVTIRWDTDAQASGWRLYYAAANGPGQTINTLDLPQAKHELSVFLKSGQNFHVRVQALASACDSPMSELATVTVP